MLLMNLRPWSVIAYVIVAPPIFVCPVFSCINVTMLLAFHCFDYDVTFLSMVNLEDTASDRHKKKREMCLKKVANTSNTYPYTKWVIFRNAIFLHNSKFHVFTQKLGQCSQLFGVCTNWVPHLCHLGALKFWGPYYPQRWI